MPSARDLRRRIRFQQRSIDVNGDRLGDWEAGFVRSAGVSYISLKRGGEVVLQGRIQGQAPVGILVRDDSDTRLIGADWRAVTADDGYPATFNIRSIGATERVGYLNLLAEAGEND